MSTGKNRSKIVKRSDLRSALVIVLHFAFVLLPLYCAAYSGPSLLWLACWVWFGLSMQALLNLMHETAHLNVFKSRRANELLGRWVLGPMMFTDFDRYREVHWTHHRNIGREGDPKYSYRIDIRGFNSVKFLLRSLLLIEAIRKLRYVHGAAGPGEAQKKPPFWLLRTVLFHGVLATSVFSVAHGAGLAAAGTAVFVYGLVYFYGILSLTVMAANLRAIAEHQLHEVQTESSGVAALRNLASTPVTWLIFGAYGFSEHATHHLNPALPYYQLLPETLRLSEERGAADRGYFEVLFAIVAAREESPSARRARGVLMF
jgi:fatty acid desaturase